MYPPIQNDAASGTGQDGASAVEYALLVAAVAAVITVVVFAMGGMITTMFGSTCEAIDSGSFSHSSADCS